MDFNFEAFIWYVLAADCAFAVAVSFFSQDWYRDSFPEVFKHFPATKAWCMVYLILILWLGYSLHRQGILPW